MQLNIKVNGHLLDQIERIVIILCFGGLVYRMVNGVDHHSSILNLLPILSESLVVAFVLIRRASDTVSRNVGDWALAVSATGLPMMAMPGDHQPLSVMAGGILFIVGFLVHIAAKISLGRSFGILPANRGLKFIGPYRFVRHPMYAGYLMTNIGFLLLVPSLFNLAIYTLALVFQVYRLLAEERLLSIDPVYGEYKSAVRYKLIPGVF